MWILAGEFAEQPARENSGMFLQVCLEAGDNAGLAVDQLVLKMCGW